MKRVYSASNPPEAHLVKAMLAENGIPAEVRGTDLFPLRGQVPFSTSTEPSVWILREEQYEDARAVVAEYEATRRQGSADDTPWTCTHCGEECEGQFTECWNCGKSRDA